MQPIAQQIHRLLIKKHKTIAVAESCTGGLLSKILTDEPGSSSYFVLGLVAYSNQSKESILRIPHSLIARYGAVSAPVARAMAENVRKIAKTDFGIAITGIAGPGGATANKPIGTVFIAINSRTKTICRKFKFRGPRATIRQKSALKALELLNAHIHRY